MPRARPASAARLTIGDPSPSTTTRSAPHCAAPTSARRTRVTLSFSVDVDALATSLRMSRPDAGFAMRPIGAGTGADPTERRPKVPACSAPSAISSRTSWCGSRDRPAKAPTPTPACSAGAAAARRTWPRSCADERHSGALRRPGRRRRSRRSAADRCSRRPVSRCACGGAAAPARSSCSSRPAVNARCSPTGAPRSTSRRSTHAWLDGVTVLHLPAYSLTVGRLAETSAALALRAKAAGVTRQRRRVVDRPARALTGSPASSPSWPTFDPTCCSTNDDEAASARPVRPRARRSRARRRAPRSRHGHRCGRDRASLANVSPATVRDAADTTGAGDAFAAGFLPALQQRGTPRRRTRRGARLRGAHPRRTRRIDGRRAMNAVLVSRGGRDRARRAAGRGRARVDDLLERSGFPAPRTPRHSSAAPPPSATATRVPAITAVIDGVARVGLEPEEHERVLTGSAKVASRDLPVRGRPAVVVRSHDGVGGAHACRPRRRHGLRHRWDRRRAPRGRDARATSAPISARSPRIRS